MKLTEQEKKKIIGLIEAGNPLPVIYKAKLFGSSDTEFLEATKDYKLVYKGKARKEDIIAQTPAAPFQLIRTFNSDAPFNDGWRNMLIFGDNLLALKTIYDDQRGQNIHKTKNRIKLIYIDPPFATKQDFMKDREKAYRDKIIGAQFIEFLRKRLILLREILADDGGIYVHLDIKKGHYIKIILDEVFGQHNFRNEIIWKRTTARSDSSTFNHIHDSLYFYSKSENCIWNQQYTTYSNQYIESNFKTDASGRLYRESPLTASEKRRGFSGEPWRGVDPNKIGKGRHWSIPKFVRHLLSKEAKKNSLLALDELEKLGRILWAKDGEGRPNLIQYADELEGVELQSIWSDFSALSGNAPESTNYPTQKPEQMLARIIKTSSNKNDIILDAFAGSGTTLAVAEKLNCRWIGMDCGKLAIYTIQKRLLHITDQIGSGAKDESRDYERVADFKDHSKSNSRGLFFIYEKARKGDLVITDSFLKNLAEFISENLSGSKQEEFSLVCPEDKLALETLELIEEEGGTGEGIVEVGRVKFLISFIQPKAKTDKAKPLKAKEFTLYHAGVYDNKKILEMPWAQYKPFVVQLFSVRSEPHKIHGFEADGYIGVNSAFIWDYPNQKNLVLDREYVKTLHHVLGGKAGRKFYVIAPIVAMGFMEDEIPIGDTTYVFLKVPLSVLMALIERGEPGSLKQPASENDVNEVIDAIGFDFISQPEVKATYYRRNPIERNLLNVGKKDFSIEMSLFKEDAPVSC